MAKPLAIDLFCGLGGWTEGLLAEGWDVVGFDIERHVYGGHRYPAQLVVQDVRTLVGSQFAGAGLIVASPPCQAYSYRAMPWSRARALPPPDNELFETCFRLQREACEAAGRHVPLVVENVRGAQRWVGRARWNFGSFYLWGDVPALMPPGWHDDGGWRDSGTLISCNRMVSDGRRVHRFGGSEGNPSGSFQSASVEGVKLKDHDGYERNHPAPFGWKAPRTSSNSVSRKFASAMIAKIPLPLSRYIGAVYRLAGFGRTVGA